MAVPLGIAAAIALSDILPYRVRQLVKPVIEILAALPSVAYGFFALVIFAPLLQNRGGSLLALAAWLIALPLGLLIIFVISEMAVRSVREDVAKAARLILAAALTAILVRGLLALSAVLNKVAIGSGTNALNVSIILGIMALPTIVSVAEDSLQAAGRELREGSYALGATRAETLFKVIIPAAGSGIIAAVILGVMRAIGETMVVWMASGNAAQIPTPWFNFLSPVRTLTATIAGDMGEADQVTRLRPLPRAVRPGPVPAADLVRRQSGQRMDPAPPATPAGRVEITWTCRSRKLFDRSLTGISIMAVVLMSLSLLVLLAPIFSRGLGAFFFRGTSEYRRLHAGAVQPRQCPGGRQRNPDRRRGAPAGL